MVNDGILYRKHFIRNHCNYGYHRRCQQCGQHFSEKSERASHACPGSPTVYSRKTGEFFYRGINSSTMSNYPIYPRLRHNQLIGHGDYSLYCVDVQRAEFGKEYLPAELPLGKIDASQYAHREYAPINPPVPPNAMVVAVFEPPGDRTVLEHIFQLYTANEEVQPIVSLVENDQHMRHLAERDTRMRPLVEKDQNMQLSAKTMNMEKGSKVQVGKYHSGNHFKNKKTTEIVEVPKRGVFNLRVCILSPHLHFTISHLYFSYCIVLSFGVQIRFKPQEAIYRRINLCSRWK